MTDEIIYAPGAGSPRPRQVFFGLWLVAMAMLCVIAATTGRWAGVLIQAPCGLVTFFVYRHNERRTFRATCVGIAARPFMKEPWSAIESVKAPTQWDECVMVRMAASGEERRTGFPVSYAEQLARIGGKPLV